MRRGIVRLRTLVPPHSRAITSKPYLCRNQDDSSSSGHNSPLVPPSTWSLHDLGLLHKDAVAGAGSDALNEDELSRLAGYAHLDLDGVNVDRESLQRDLGAIINCMTLLQTADLSDVSKEEMYAPPEYAQASARLRKDVVTEGGLDKEDQVLANTKETAHNQFVVPLVNCK
ncbi:aspartyl glutamyl-trna(asn gln) c subunit [Nannochloropsis oceanica]